MPRSRSRSKSHKKKCSKDRDHKHRKQKKAHKDESEGDAGHYEFHIGQLFKHGKYEITRFLSDGTFGRVVEVKNLEDQKFYAMKIIRAVERYVDSAKTEEQILKFLAEKDRNHDSQVVRLYEAFERKKNYCMIFERLGMSLYDILKKNEFIGFPLKMVQSFFRQMLKSIGFMHSVRLTHTDLKPENILVCSTELIKTKIRADSEVETNDLKKQIKNIKSQIYLPATDQIKIIDMGGATFDHEHHSAVINTRQYRAPEVILGCLKWDKTSDIWGMACIVIELITGELFFQTRKSDCEHLAMIESVCGSIPQWMVNKTGPPLDKYFDTSERTFQKYNSYFTWPFTQANFESLKRIHNMKKIEEQVPNMLLVDLLKRMLKIDPQHRLTCAQALAHPFFNEKFD